MFYLLNVINNQMQKNLPKVAKPFNKLCCIILVELDIREIHLQYG